KVRELCQYMEPSGSCLVLLFPRVSGSDRMSGSRMRVYFDYNATTPPTAEVVDAVVGATRDLFGNASSVHYFGQQAKTALDQARSSIAELIAGDPSEVVFTGGGTESDNFAIRGAADAL